MSDESKEQQNGSDPDYIRVLTHQLKSPINSIQSLLNTIFEGFTGEIPPKTSHFIEKAIGRATEAKEMISDLLDYELYSQNQTTPQEELDIVPLVDALGRKYALRASEKNVSLQLNLPLKYKISMHGDSRGLEHAFRNIIENAIKYTPSNGSVTLKLSVSEEEQTCQIAVSDSGYGIPEDELKGVFDPFYRSIKHKSNITGTGLGLPIAKKVISNHSGTISVESQEGEGTTFTISLPYIHLEKIEQEADTRKKVVIIGGMIAGPKAAARLRRLDEDLDITIIEKNEFLSYSGCGLPSYISDKVHSPRALMSTADNTLRDVTFFETIENVMALNNTVALAIDREKNVVSAQNLKTKIISEIPYDVLILATGTELSVPKIPGISQKGVYSLHSLEEAEAVKKEFSQRNAKDVCIIGGGLVGTSLAESLLEIGARVTILEEKPYILSKLMDRDIALKIQYEINKRGIKIITDTEMTEIVKTKNHLTIIAEDDSYYTDLIILSAGLQPNTILAREAGLDIGNSGGIQVTKYLQTSDEKIYAIGDCTENFNRISRQHEYWAFGSISTKMGRIVADNICGRPLEFQGSVGTAMFKVFDLNVARTGLTLRRAKENRTDVESVTVTGLDRAHYYENAEYVTLKVIADKETKTILGAQGYGKGTIVSKIQMLAFAITQSLTLDNMFTLDLGYVPSFNNPIDFVQTACLVLNNKIDGLFNTITVEEFEQEKDALKWIIDVSPLAEHTFNSIPGSLNIPLENIRRESPPFDKTANAVLYSKTSSGAYKAYRYLRSKGYSNLRVLEGGYVYWKR